MDRLCVFSSAGSEGGSRRSRCWGGFLARGSTGATVDAAAVAAAAADEVFSLFAGGSGPFCIV